jgi:hypothetical protein
MPQGWGDSQPCTDSARIDVSDAQVGTKKPGFEINQETHEGKLRRPGELLDKENPRQGPGADSEEKHERASDIDTALADSLKALDPKWPIREADVAQCSRHFALVPPEADNAARVNASRQNSSGSFATLAFCGSKSEVPRRCLASY